MELGNMIFGHSRGEWSVPREKEYENPICALWDEVVDRFGKDVLYGDGFSNGVFEIRAYYWGDCNCGFEERWGPKDEKWCAEHEHADSCYQTELHARLLAYDVQSGYAELDARTFGYAQPSLLSGFDVEFEHAAPGVAAMVMRSRQDDAMKEWRKASDARHKFEGALYDELCKKHGVDRNWGAAVHCTCEYGRLREEWCATDDHSPDCALVRPNFLHKPSGLELRWYKYPLRDSYMNREVSPREWRTICRECIDSLPHEPR